MSGGDGDRAPLSAWIARDLTITVVLAFLVMLLGGWSAGALAGIVGSTVGFIAAYILCYIYHEWGHLIGARVTGSNMPLNGLKGALIGRFDIAAHSRAQFLALSWGGVLGYLSVAALTFLIYLYGGLAWVGAGLAAGGAAFVVQSLAVDLPQIVRVVRGEDAVAVSASGASADVILRRTWQTWLPLALVIVIANWI